MQVFRTLLACLDNLDFFSATINAISKLLIIDSSKLMIIDSKLQHKLHMICLKQFWGPILSSLEKFEAKSLIETVVNRQKRVCEQKCKLN